jgi:hypothetical protein
LHAELFVSGGAGAKGEASSGVRLEVLDRATLQALERLEASGLILSRVRATRHLHPSGAAGASPLTKEEEARAADFRRLAAKKLKFARILLAEDLAEEAVEALCESARLAGCALAVEERLTEMPATLGDALTPPLSYRWGETTPKLRRLIGGATIAPNALVDGVVEALARAGV